MKSISSAIIAAAGLHCFAAGGSIEHDETQMFFTLVGAIVGLVGLIAWGKYTFSPGPPQDDAKF